MAEWRNQFLFVSDEKYFTSEHSKWVKCFSVREKKCGISKRPCILFSLQKSLWHISKHNFWGFSKDFQPLSKDFRRFSQKFLEADTCIVFLNISKIIYQIKTMTFEDNQRLLKTFEEDPTMYQSYISKFKYRVKNDIR